MLLARRAEQVAGRAGRRSKLAHALAEADRAWALRPDEELLHAAGTCWSGGGDVGADGARVGGVVSALASPGCLMMTLEALAAGHSRRVPLPYGSLAVLAPL